MYRPQPPPWLSRTPPVALGNFGGAQFKSAASLAGHVHFGQFEQILAVTHSRPSWSRSRCRFVDVGANDGAITLALAAYGCRVKSFEALGVNAARVIGGVQLSGLTDRVRLVRGAVADTCGNKMTIDLNTDGNQHNGQILAPGGYGKDDPRHGKELKTETIFTLPLCAHLSGDADMVKIDIEGFEHRALRGAVPWLRQFRVPWIHSEFSPSNMRQLSGLDPASFIKELAALGYKIFLGDCFHNINDAAIRSLPAKCPRTDNEAKSLVGQIAAGQASEYEVTLDSESLVKVLLDHSKPVECCLLNLIAFRSRDF
jgi:FkbM family methyltransferase